MRSVGDTTCRATCVACQSIVSRRSKRPQAWHRCYILIRSSSSARYAPDRPVRPLHAQRLRHRQRNRKKSFVRRKRYRAARVPSFARNATTTAISMVQHIVQCSCSVFGCGFCRASRSPPCASLQAHKSCAFPTVPVHHTKEYGVEAILVGPWATSRERLQEFAAMFGISTSMRSPRSVVSKQNMVLSTLVSTCCERNYTGDKYRPSFSLKWG
jgi:hypothetical protein